MRGPPAPMPRPPEATALAPTPPGPTAVPGRTSPPASPPRRRAGQPDPHAGGDAAARGCDAHDARGARRARAARGARTGRPRARTRGRTRGRADQGSGRLPVRRARRPRGFTDGRVRGRAHGGRGARTTDGVEAGTPAGAAGRRRGHTGATGATGACGTARATGGRGRVRLAVDALEHLTGRGVRLVESGDRVGGTPLVGLVLLPVGRIGGVVVTLGAHVGRVGRARRGAGPDGGPRAVALGQRVALGGRGVQSGRGLLEGPGALPELGGLVRHRLR